MKRRLPIVVSKRLVLTTVLLITAPGAAVAFMLLDWAPERIAARRVYADARRDAAAVAEARARTGVASKQLESLEQAEGEARLAPWLSKRDHDAVSDRFAEAFRHPLLSVDRLTLDEPGLYAAESRDNLLACERATIECTGPYAALTECLDRLFELGLPLRITRLTWTVNGAQMRLAMNVDVPFIPDDPLRTQLATAAKLKENGPPHAP